MARFKTQGFISLQLMLSMILMQLSFLAVWPMMKVMLLNWQARISLNQLQLDLASLRVMSVMLHKNLYLHPLSLDKNWALGWRVTDDKTILWQKKPYQIVNLKIEWHGFTHHPPLKFYADVLKNHVNGYFKASAYQLWVNRLGYSRIKHDI